MSKKKNKKFRKSNPKKTISQVKTQVVSEPTSGQQVTDSVETAEVEEPKKDEIELLNEKYLPIRRDVKKLLIVLASLAVLFIAFYLVGAKTTALAKTGDWLYKISNIQTQ